MSSGIGMQSCWSLFCERKCYSYTSSLGEMWCNALQPQALPQDWKPLVYFSALDCLLSSPSYRDSQERNPSCEGGYHSLSFSPSIFIKHSGDNRQQGLGAFLHSHGLWAEQLCLLCPFHIPHYSSLLPSGWEIAVSVVSNTCIDTLSKFQWDM